MNKTQFVSESRLTFPPPGVNDIYSLENKEPVNKFSDTKENLIFWTRLDPTFFWEMKTHMVSL